MIGVKITHIHTHIETLKKEVSVECMDRYRYCICEFRMGQIVSNQYSLEK